MLIVCLAIVILGLCGVAITLGPEMFKPVEPKDIKPKVVKFKPAKPKEMPVHIPEENSQPTTFDNREERLAALLDEKNKNIDLLQTELKVFHIQVQNFNTVKSLMEEEIQRLREQNRIFRSELGLPTAVPKEQSTV
jgi:hypothetical protein